MHINRGWLAGFFDGEGTIVLYGRTSNAHSVALKVDSTDYDCLQRFRATYGGSIHKRTIRECNRKQQWRWNLCSSNEVYDTLEEWYPLLSARRRAKADEAFIRLSGNKNLRPRTI